MSITYGFKTHKAEHIGGWTSGVPNPDDDGIWFYIDLHDADSTAQIHTQPITANVLLGGMNVQLLILEGEQTKRVSGAIWKIIMAHGAEERPHGRETVANLEVEPTENNAAGSLRAAKP